MLDGEQHGKVHRLDDGGDGTVGVLPPVAWAGVVGEFADSGREHGVGVATAVGVWREPEVVGGWEPESDEVLLDDTVCASVVAWRFPWRLWRARLFWNQTYSK